MTISIRTYLELAAVLIIIAGVVAYTMHERKVGRAQIELADARATQKAQDAAKAQTAALLAQSQKAATEASHAQAILDAYMAANPVHPVRLCYQNLSSSHLSETASTASGTSPAGAGPPAVSGVSSGVASADISGGLALLMRAASKLAIIDREFQTR